MFGYYLDLALRSLKRNKVLTALMVLAIALGIGASMTTLTPGIDCPPHATFVDTVGLNPDGTSVVRKATVCIFERTDGDPAWRRLNDGRAATDLVIRYAAAVGNYDYLMDYVCRQDGSIKARIGAVGARCTVGASWIVGIRTGIRPCTPRVLRVHLG